MVNGVQILITDSSGNILVDLLDDFRIFTNGDWGIFGDINIDFRLGAGNNYVHIQIPISTDSGAGLPIDGTKGHRFVVRLNDDFTSPSTLQRHLFLVQGIGRSA